MPLPLYPAPSSTAPNPYIYNYTLYHWPSASNYRALYKNKNPFIEYITLNPYQGLNEEVGKIQPSALRAFYLAITLRCTLDLYLRNQIRHPPPTGE